MTPPLGGRSIPQPLLLTLYLPLSLRNARESPVHLSNFCFELHLLTQLLLSLLGDSHLLIPPFKWYMGQMVLIAFHF